MTRARGWAWGVAILTAGALALYWKAGASEAEIWATLERRDLVLEVKVEGLLEAVNSVSITPPAIPQMWNFKISMLVPEGTEVVAGQPIVDFDPTELRQRLRSKVGERDSSAGEFEKRVSELEIERQNLELNLAESEARLRRQELELQVPEDLVAARDIELVRIDRDLSRFEIDNLTQRLEFLDQRSDAELSALRRRRDRAAQRVEELEGHLASMQVPAPRAGTVIYPKSDGEKHRIGDSVWRAETILEIPDLAAMTAVGQIDETDIGRVKVGQPVELRLDAHPDHQFHGSVGALHEAVKQRSATDPRKFVEIEILLEVTDPDRMRPGMRFKGTVEVERLTDRLCLPNEVPESLPEGPRVIVAHGVGREEVFPTLGRRNSECSEVLEGLKVGDRVLLSKGTRE
ncbi:MAG: efflux RND transporter periplasmic adaptor subunit [Thermoanaerobaculia bacterium]|nr:efflux RND transporter periplasmic adaptor subunit [Thermoanaerobaculia bacterium]